MLLKLSLTRAQKNKLFKHAEGNSINWNKK